MYISNVFQIRIVIMKFNVSDIVFYKKDNDCQRSYRIVLTPDNCLMKRSDSSGDWIRCYAYAGFDKHSGKEMIFVREQIDFENGFSLLD